MQEMLSRPGKPKSRADLLRASDIQVRQQLISSAPETLQSMLGPEARAQRISKLGATERPFAVGRAKAWLEEASIPTEGSGASLSSLYGLPEGFSPSQIGVTGDAAFDAKAEQQAREYLASLPAAPERVFAAGEAVKGWLDQASRPLTSSATSRASTLFEKYSPSQAEVEGDQTFDGRAEEQTRQYSAGLASTPSSSRRPFAAGYLEPGWLEAASTLMVNEAS